MHLEWKPPTRTVAYRGLAAWCEPACNGSSRFWPASRLWPIHQSLQRFHAHTEILEPVLVASECRPGLWKEITQMEKKKEQLQPFFFFSFSPSNPPEGLPNLFSYSSNPNHWGTGAKQKGNPNYTHGHKGVKIFNSAEHEVQTSPIRLAGLGLKAELRGVRSQCLFFEVNKQKQHLTNTISNLQRQSVSWWDGGPTPRFFP